MRAAAPANLSFAIAEVCDAALAVGALERVEEVLRDVAALKPSQRSQSIQAQEIRIAAKLTARRGDDDLVEPRFFAAEARFRELEAPFWRAQPKAAVA